MKTFRWTVPELPQSRAEKKHSAELALKRRGIPTKDELDEFRRWEKTVERGFWVSVIRVTAVMTAFFIVCYFLRSQDILISRDSSITPFFGGLLGGAISTFVSWRRYQESRSMIHDHLNKKGELSRRWRRRTRRLIKFGY